MTEEERTVMTDAFELLEELVIFGAYDARKHDERAVPVVKALQKLLKEAKG